MVSQLDLDRIEAVDLPQGPTSEDADSGCHPIFLEAPATVSFKKIRKRLLKLTRAAIDDFSMIEKDTRWLVCLSGGKDSYTLLSLLLDLKWRGLLPVDLLACNLDQAQPGFPQDVLPAFFDKYDIPYRIERQDTYSIVKEKVPQGATYCALCSRLRRGNLYRIAREEGCSAVILGHHRDDILETFFLNLFHGGRLASMPPKLVNDEGDLQVMRPLAYCAEDDITRFSNGMGFPIIPCDLCGSQDGLQRNAMKQMLSDIEKRMPGRKDVMIRALSNVRPSHLMDRKLFDFRELIPALGVAPDQ
ncbi:MAG: tRNA 2-thiocytidine(32) synthetase TtcA [Pseudomonadota bacterium]